MKPMLRISIIITAFLLIGSSAHAQFLEDALRLSQPATIVSARAAGMGNAFTGVADDYSALFYNPAGLGQLKRSEFTVGLMNLRTGNDASTLGSTTAFDNSSTSLNSIGFALPFPVQRGSFVLAAGYNRLLNFTGGYSTSAFNPYSSIQRSLYDDADANYDLAWQLGLEDTLLFTYRDQGKPGWLAIPVADKVFQQQDVLESGNLGQWAFGGSMEVSPGLMAGLTFNILTGSYRYDRTFTELDNTNAHQESIVGVGFVTRTDFQRLDVNQTVNQDISGWNARFGILYRLKEKARFGFTIATPMQITIKEDYSSDGKALFATGAEQYFLPTSSNEYDVTTPWVFGFGASVNPVSFVTVSGDIDLTDYTSTEFSNSTVPDLNVLNKDVKKLLRSTTNFRVGTEITIPDVGLIVRGGYGMAFSPYSNDPSDYDSKMISFGLGYTVEDSFTINATALLTSYKTYTISYSDPNLSVPDSALRVDENISRADIMFSIAYRF